MNVHHDPIIYVLWIYGLESSVALQNYTWNCVEEIYENCIFYFNAHGTIYIMELYIYRSIR